MLEIVKAYLLENKYQNKISEFEEAFNSHPNYPSLFALTDSLAIVGVDNVAAKVDKEELANLPNTFLAILKDGLNFVQKDTDGIQVKNDSGKSAFLSKEVFLQNWEGIVVAIQEEDNEPFIDNKNVLNSFVLIFLAIGLFILKILADSFFSVTSILVFVMSLIGFFTSLLILNSKYNDVKNPFVQKMCNSNSLIISCENVIDSKFSKINNWLEFSDLPFVYFSSALISNIIMPRLFSEIIMINVLLLPVIFYSIWLQKFQIKKWCTLCLMVSLIVVTTSLLYFISSSEYNYNEFHVLFVVFSFVTLFWQVLKSKLKSELKGKAENLSLKKIKRNPDVFFKLLKGINCPDSLEKFNKIIIGNKTREVNLSLILSPSCSHCHNAYQEAITLQKSFVDTLKIEVFYNVNPKNESNIYRDLVLRVLQINREDPALSLKALNDWHLIGMDLEKWFSKWGKEYDEISLSNLEKQYAWCQVNEFNYAPVRLINRKFLPQEYTINDLKYFINELIPHSINED